MTVPRLPETADTVIITPVFEDREAAERLFAELHRQMGARVFIVAVDDGSVRHPLTAHSLGSAAGLVLRLRRNVGHQRAIAIGIHYAAEHLGGAQHFVVMDCDGEDLPASIPALLTALQPDDVDMVVAERRRRVETFRFKAFYQVYRRLFTALTGRSIGFGNFMALKPRALHRLAAMQELWTHLAACALASRLRIQSYPLDRGPRYAGQSKMNFVGLALHGFKALMVFAEDVLVRVGIACSLVAGASVVVALIAVGLKIAGFATPGWFSVAFGILMLMFLQTGAMTLMSLMLTGIARSGTISKRAYRVFIDSVLENPSCTEDS